MSEWLRQLNQVWLQRLQQAKTVKKKQFGQTAAQLWEYLCKDYDDLYFPIWSHAAGHSHPSFYRPRVNKFQEFVDLYIPFIMASTPVRRVAVRQPMFPEELVQSAMILGSIPMRYVDKMQRTALATITTLLEWWLNYITEEYHLLREARLAVTEALVKGRGVVWHGLLPHASGIIPASFYDSVDNLFIDPSAKTLRDAGFIMRKRTVASWLAAKQLGVDEQKLLRMCRDNTPEDPSDDTPVITFYEVYSRIGSGLRYTSPDDPLRTAQEALDQLGDHLWFAIAEGAEYPLNMDPDVIQSDIERLKVSVQWPVASFGNTIHPWPMSVLDFYPNTDNAWARSPLQAGVPMQMILDHLYGYIYAQAVRSTRAIIVVPDHVDSQLVTALRGYEDLAIVPISSKQITDFEKELYHTITLPPVNRDVLQFVQLLEDQFSRAVGLDPILYGAQPQRQYRSAAEVNIRFQAASGRAQFMADQVEEWMDQVAAKDGVLSRLYVPATQIATLVGEGVIPDEQGQPQPAGPLSQAWGATITTDDPYAAAIDFQFQIVSGTGRRRDKEQATQAATFLAQTVLPPVVQASIQGGDFTMFNKMLERLSNALDLDAGLFRLERQDVQQEVPGGQAGEPPPEGGVPSQEGGQPSQGFRPPG